MEAAQRVIEPAEGTCRAAAQDHPRRPRLTQDLIESVCLPGPQQRHEAATADVDQILRKQVLPRIADACLAAEQRDVRGLAALGREGSIEAHDVVVGIAAGRRQKADSRTARVREPEHVVVEQGVPPLHREPTAAERDDLAEPWRLHAQNRRLRPNSGLWPRGQESAAEHLQSGKAALHGLSTSLSSSSRYRPVTTNSVCSAIPTALSPTRSRQRATSTMNIAHSRSSGSSPTSTAR